jgi:hypothetical protein
MELSIAMTIAFLVIGAVVMVMGRGFGLVETNATYAALQNAALSSFEFLPRDIGYAGKVDIVNTMTMTIAQLEEAASADKWHYIAAIDANGRIIAGGGTDGKVTHVYWDEAAGAVRKDAIVGSEKVASLSFTSSSSVHEEGEIVWRGVNVSIETRGGASNGFVLERSIQVRAREGATFNGFPPPSPSPFSGPVLRFSGKRGAEPILELFKARNYPDGSSSPPLSFRLDMASADTWKGTYQAEISGDDRIEYKFDTQFDAVLAFGEAVEMEEDPVFTWLIADPDIFFDRLDRIGVTREAFAELSSQERSKKLAEALYDKNGVSWLDIQNLNLGWDETSAPYPESEIGNLWWRLESEPRLSPDGDRINAADPYRKGGDPHEPKYGYRAVEASRSVSADILPDKTAYRVIPGGSATDRFSWGKAVYDNINHNYSIFDDAIIIGVARYKLRGEDAQLIASALKLKEDMESSLWNDLYEEAQALANGDDSALGSGQFVNLHPDFRENLHVDVVPRTARTAGGDPINYGRGKFTVAAAHSVGNRGALMMTTLTDKHFRHLVNDLSDELRGVYGVTNYSVYIDKRLMPSTLTEDFMPDGGMGVLLNGSAVETARITGSRGTADENFSSGYMFNWDPGSAGLIMRFGHYSSSIGKPASGAATTAFFDNASWILWGVQPMYAYDAAKSWPAPGHYTRNIKRALNAPAQIAFFPFPREDPRSLDIVAEDFEDHVSPPSYMVEKPNLNARTNSQINAIADTWVGWGVFYRPPFLPRFEGRGTFRDSKDYRNGAYDINNSAASSPSATFGPVPIRIFSRGRDNIGLNQWNLDGNGWGTPKLWFGGSYGTSWGPGGVGAVYAFWHPQTWHLYDNMQWEWRQVATKTREPAVSSAHTIRNFAYNENGDWRSGWRFDVEYDLENSRHDFAKTMPKEWTRRHLLKLTVLEVTRDILASEVDSEWKNRLHHRHYRDDNLSGALTYLDGDVIHVSGDMFVRAELIQLKRATDSKADEDEWIYDSRNWVYSKPLWFGKFRGDGWRGKGEPEERTTWSLFKRMGMSMMHLVADPEPEGGDRQSFRGIVHGETQRDLSERSDDELVGPGRGVRVRSWKDHFRGWKFSDDPDVNIGILSRDHYAYDGNLEKTLRDRPTSPRDVLHPDLTFTDDGFLDDGGKKKDAPLIDKLKDLEPKHRLDGVWTPPIAIDLNGWALRRNQSLVLTNPAVDIDPNSYYYKPEYLSSNYRYSNPAYYNTSGAPPNYGGGDFAGTTGTDGETYFSQSLKSPKGFSSGVHKVYQWGPPGPTGNEVTVRKQVFGQYAYHGQEVEFERRLVTAAVEYPNSPVADREKRKPAVYKFGYNGKYTDMLYARLSLLRPDSSRYSSATANQKALSKTPVWGLYAIRAWDYQRGKMGVDSTEDQFIYDFQNFDYTQTHTGLYGNAGEARKRLLMVVQGLQLKYQPSRQTVSAQGDFTSPSETRYIEPLPGGSDANLHLRAPRGGTSQHSGTKKDYRQYKKDRERIFGLHFWGNARSKNSNRIVYLNNPNTYEINEIWIGEGFSPVEVREILGLDPEQFPLPAEKLSETGLASLDPSEIGQVKEIMKFYSTDDDL